VDGAATEEPGVERTAAAAFEGFFREVEPMLRRVAVAYVREPAVAHDLTQETLIRAWQNWPKLQEHPHPEAWCRTVLHNLAASRWRRLRLERACDGALQVAEPPPGAEHLDVLEAIRHLPAKRRRAVVLHDILGFTADEVAEELGVPAGSVRSMLSRARRTLSEQLADRLS
jgi:RNA polymerase sigma-70 factor (ECF subfamily)